VHEAAVGMFITGPLQRAGAPRGVMENEGIPVAEYEQLAKRFKPKPNRRARLARSPRQAGQKYMVMTTKHHEGFASSPPN